MINLFKIALKNLRTRRLRSWLTIVGIAIGIFLVIALFSLSQGIREAINSQLKALGDRILIVMPGSESDIFMSMMGGAKLEKEDIAAIQDTKGVEEVVTFSYSADSIRYMGETKQIILTAVPLRQGLDVLRENQGFSLKTGTWPRASRREVIIGAQLENNIFSNKVRVGDMITIGGKRIEVVGILNSLGSKYDDTTVFLDQDLYMELTGIQDDSAQQAIVKIGEDESPDKVAERIEENLMSVRKRKRGTDEQDFMVLTSEKMGQIAGNVIGILQVAVIGFAGIAIIVGGIGIMNTMFTSVRERIREIGIMKAIGARNTTISRIFLLESGIIGLIGGLGGTIVGIIFAKGIELYFQIHPVIYLKAYISSGIIIFGLLFSFVLGCLSGYLPARSAAKLKPAESLRRFE